MFCADFCGRIDGAKRQSVTSVGEVTAEEGREKFLCTQPESNRRSLTYETRMVPQDCQWERERAGRKAKSKKRQGRRRPGIRALFLPSLSTTLTKKARVFVHVKLPQKCSSLQSACLRLAFSNVFSPAASPPPLMATTAGPGAGGGAGETAVPDVTMPTIVHKVKSKLGYTEMHTPAPGFGENVGCVVRVNRARCSRTLYPPSLPLAWEILGSHFRLNRFPTMHLCNSS
jgi:hypothetical protein